MGAERPERRGATVARRGGAARCSAARTLACQDPLNAVLLAADEPERLREEKELSFRRTEAAGTAWHRLNYLILWTEHGLYTGEVEGASRRVEAEWPALRRDPAFRAPTVRKYAWVVRALCACGAALASTGRERRRCLQVARRAARELDRGAMSFCAPCARLVRAGIASIEGKPEEAISHLERAETGFEAAGMALHLAVCRRRRGQLLGGEAGAALVTAAERFMASEGIKNPERMSNVNAPGRWSR